MCRTTKVYRTPRGPLIAFALCVFVRAAFAAPTRMGNVAATPVTEPASLEPSDAYIDWSARELFAWGEGRAPKEVPLLVEALPFAEQAALEAARTSMRTLVAHAGLLPKRLGDRLGGDDPLPAQAPARGTLRNFLNRLLRGSGDDRNNQQALNDARVLTAIGFALESGHAAQTSYREDGSVQLQLRLPLDGGRGGLGEAWMRLRPQNASRLAAERKQSRAGTLPTVRPPTGVVVQARGLNVSPTLWPRLVRGKDGCQHGQALYGEEHLSDEMLRSYGVAPFVRSIEAALRAPRVADRAMLVRAGGRCPNAPATVWVDDADADAIEGEQELLREGRVVFVVD